MSDFVAVGVAFIEANRGLLGTVLGFVCGLELVRFAMGLVRL